MSNVLKFFVPPNGAAALLVGLLSVGIAKADVQVASPFGDHMVLQCETELPVWGTATPRESVIVEFAGQTKEGVADADGRWRIELDPIEASAEPRVFAVKGSFMAQPIRVHSRNHAEARKLGKCGN